MEVSENDHPLTLRGAGEVHMFAGMMILTLNLPKNAKKGTWLTATDHQIAKWISEECAELLAAIASGDPNAIICEAADLACTSLFAYDRAMRQRCSNYPGGSCLPTI